VMQGQQHVVDRRAVGHGNVSHEVGSSGPPSSHETGLLSTLRWVEKAAGSGPNRAFSAQSNAACVARMPHDALTIPGVRFRRKRGFSLLKWLNSPYRPALPEGIRGPTRPAAFQTALGRRQVVRQWILIPPYGGSNPPAPATQSLDLR
jgi:hypothetical protein